MLKNINISKKLALIVAIPMIGLIGFTVHIALAKLEIVNKMTLLHELSDFAIKSSALVHELQKERGLSAGLLGSQGMQFSTELQMQRIRTDIQIKKFNTFLKQFHIKCFKADFKNNLEMVFTLLKEIENKRLLIDELNSLLKDELLYYTNIIDSLLMNINYLSMLISHHEISNQVAAYMSILYAKEKAGIERATLNNALSRGYFPSNMSKKFISLIEAQNIYIKNFLFVATSPQKKYYHEIMQGEFIAEIEEIRKKAFLERLNMEPAYWWQLSTGRIELLKTIEDQISFDLKASALQLRKEAQFIFIFSLIIACGMVLFTIFYGKLILNETEQAYARFVPNEFLQVLNKAHILDTQLGNNEEMEMTILFSDIRSFTSLSEKMSPQENFDFLNAYLGEMGPIIRKNNGFVDKYIGDAIMALFMTADDAVNAAISMVEIQQAQKTKIGIGINTGKLMLGIIGEKSRLQCTVISDAVNLASRVENLTKSYKEPLIITQNTLDHLTFPSQYTIQLIDNLKVKGRAGCVKIFKVVN
ncbi:MAG: nitrate- and nitrite sensing domain-containing protein [Thiomargarita sp.]|nr:nitrate- and nitrite sensing domain-containing protein [Thiomargarita sp.]